MHGRAPILALGSNIVIAGHAVLDEIIDSEEMAPRVELGGGVSYSAICLKSLGYKPNIVSSVGIDFPRLYSDLFVTTTGLDVNIYKSEKTTRFKIDSSGSERRMWLLSKCRNLTIQDFKTVTGNFDFQDHVLLANPVAGEISLKLLGQLSKLFRLIFADSQGFVRSFDKKNGFVSVKRKLDFEKLRGVFALKADRRELSSWTGLETKEESLEKISSYVDFVLFTSGKEQAELYKEGKLICTIRPPAVNFRDAIGAGDILLASFTGRYLETGDAGDSFAFAVAASSLATEKIGIMKAWLSKGRIIEAMRRVKVL